MRNKSIELASYGYDKVTTLLDEENKIWLRDTGLKYMELCRVYLSYGTEFLVNQYFLYKELFINYFIK